MRRLRRKVSAARRRAWAALAWARLGFRLLLMQAWSTPARWPAIYLGGNQLLQSLQCDEEHVEGTAEPASAQTLQKPDVSFLAELLDTTSLEEPPSRRCLSSSLGSTIWVRSPPDWYMEFYIRMDLGGSFHIYPDLGRPFRSLQEADDAINRHLHDLRRPEIFKEKDEISLVEGMIQRSLYWPDGTRKKRGSKSQASENTNNRERQLVQVLVDKYNEDHNLFGDLAYELKDVVHYQSICEGEDYRWYEHFNFTTKTKGADAFDCDINNLFFAEVTHMQGGDELVISCYCMIKPNDNGHCYGCRNNGSVHMKHPNNADAYTGGHLDAYLPYGGDEWSGSDDDEETEEARLRVLYEGLDDPRVWEELFPSDATAPVEG